VQRSVRRQPHQFIDSCIDAPSVARSRLRLYYRRVGMADTIERREWGGRFFLHSQCTSISAPLVYLAVLQAAMRGREAGDDGHGTAAASTMLMGLHQPSSIHNVPALLPTSGNVTVRCSRLSIRPRVDGTPVLTTVRRRDGGLSRPTAQRRDGTVVRPSVRPTVLDGYGDDP
jgi:hypothetical protein